MFIILYGYIVCFHTPVAFEFKVMDILHHEKHFFSSKLWRYFDVLKRNINILFNIILLHFAF